MVIVKSISLVAAVVVGFVVLSSLRPMAASAEPADRYELETHQVRADFNGFIPPEIGVFVGYPVSIHVNAQETNLRGPDGEQFTTGNWYDEFTIVDPATGEEVVHCAGSAALDPGDLVVSGDLTSASLDGTVITSMTPLGGSESASICPVLRLRVQLDFSAVDEVADTRFKSPKPGVCSDVTRGSYVAASAVGVSIVAPGQPNEVTTPLGPSDDAEIASYESSIRCK